MAPPQSAGKRTADRGYASAQRRSAPQSAGNMPIRTGAWRLPGIAGSDFRKSCRCERGVEPFCGCCRRRPQRRNRSFAPPGLTDFLAKGAGGRRLGRSDGQGAAGRPLYRADFQPTAEEKGEIVRQNRGDGLSLRARSLIEAARAVGFPGNRKLKFSRVRGGPGANL